MSDNITKEYEVNYIYLLKEREFVNSLRDIYKIGKTKQSNSKRFLQYPKDSILILQVICVDCTKTEYEIIKLFANKYKQMKSIGTEYFEGNYIDMISDILSIVNLDNKNIFENKKDESNIVNEISEINNTVISGIIIPDVVNPDIIIADIPINLNENIVNIDIIKNINPLGYEKLPHNISFTLMKELLIKGDSGIIEIINLIYKENENKNFFKLISNNSYISYLNYNNKFTIEICSKNDLIDKILQKSIALIYNFLIESISNILNNKIYDKDFNVEEIKNNLQEINKKIQNISNKKKASIYKNGIKYIIDYEIKYNNKITHENILNYIHHNPSNYNDTDNDNDRKYNKDMKINIHTTYISLDQINKNLGYPLLELKLNFKNIYYDDFKTINIFENTKYYIYWNTRIENEIKYIKSLSYVSIYDIIELQKRIKNIKKTLDIMEIKHRHIKNIDDKDNTILNLNKINFEIPDEYKFELPITY